MISLHPILSWNEKLSEEVHPKFIYGHKGWLLFIGVLLVALGIHHAWQVSVDILPYLNKMQPEHQNFIQLLFYSELFKTICLLFAGINLLVKWRYSLFFTKVLMILLPSAVFFSNYIIPNGKQELFTTVRSFVTSAFLGSMPIILYILRSKRVRNTFMFYEKILPKHIICPFCLSNQHPNNDERLNKKLDCTICGKNISENTVVAYPL